MLLTCTPVPGTTSPEPVPFEHVTAAQVRRPRVCVVEPSGPPGARPSPGPTPSESARRADRGGQEREGLGERRVVETGVELLRSGLVRLMHRRDHVLHPVAPQPLQQVEAQRYEDAAADGGGLVWISRPRNAARTGSRATERTRRDRRRPARLRARSPTRRSAGLCHRSRTAPALGAVALQRAARSPNRNASPARRMRPSGAYTARPSAERVRIGSRISSR